MPKKEGVRFPRAEAMAVARFFLIELDPFVERSAVSGSLRRGLPDCGDVDILIIPKRTLPGLDIGKLIRSRRLCVGEPQVEGKDILIFDARSPTGRLIPINVFVASWENWGAALHYTTGSRDYNIIVRGRAKDKGLRADQYGVWEGKRKIERSGETEADYCRAIGIPWIPPEARTGESRGGALSPRFRTH